jgi:hypothetical protein
MVTVISVRTFVEYGEIVAYLKHQSLPEFKCRQEKPKFERKANSFKCVNDLLYLKKGENYLPVLCWEDTDGIYEVMNKLHLPGHIGIKMSWF